MVNLRRKLEKFYDHYCQQLFTYALSITRRHDLSEDAIHNAFSKLLTIKESPQNLKVYVFRSVRNSAIDLVRKEKHQGEPLEPLVFSDSPNPRETSEMVEFKKMVKNALINLSEEERETIVLHLYADLTFREIAEMREISMNTIMSWYRRGMEKLRKELEKS